MNLSRRLFLAGVATAPMMQALGPVAPRAALWLEGVPIYSDPPRPWPPVSIYNAQRVWFAPDGNWHVAAIPDADLFLPAVRGAA